MFVKVRTSMGSVYVQLERLTMPRFAYVCHRNGALRRVPKGRGLLLLKEEACCILRSRPRH